MKNKTKRKEKKSDVRIKERKRKRRPRKYFIMDRKPLLSYQTRKKIEREKKERCGRNIRGMKEGKL